jgi:putative flippase GtrA
MRLPPALHRLLRYGMVGGGTFALDLALMFLLRAAFGMEASRAAALSFLAAVSVNYLVSRHLVFAGTARKLAHGYGLFIGGALLGATLTGLGVALLTTLTAWPLLVIRFAVSMPIGLLNYLFNLYVNFKVAGQHG